MTSDWRSYDDIADRYDDVWAPRFVQVAEQIWGRVTPAPGSRILDVGTGTGIVPRVFRERGGRARLVVGCDRAEGMLRRAADATPLLCPVRADATSLPFVSGSFTVVTASFVLSHLPGYAIGLAEMHRVLVRGGTLAVSAWGPTDDPCSALWHECLAAAIPKAEIDRALMEVAPAEALFSNGHAMKTALRDAGFVHAAADAFVVEIDTDIDSFMTDREMNSGGRYARSVLAPDRWAQFRATTRLAFQNQFGSSFRYTRRAHVVTAMKA